MNEREKRALVIAATAKIIQHNGLWVVPSASAPAKNYLVNLALGTCTCEDHKEWQHECKHVYAAKFVAQRDGVLGQPIQPVVPPDPLTFGEKKTYKQDWPAYNLAQTTEKHRFQVLLQDLCSGLANPPPNKPGRLRTPLSDVVFATAFKVYSTVSTRRFSCDLKDAKEKGYVSKAIHYNSICAYLEWPGLTPVLNQLIVRSSLPLRSVEVDFAADSTGFSTSRFVRWFDEKYGVHRSGHDWVKAHAMAGVKTNVVTAIEIRERSANDAPMFRPLLDTTRKSFTVKEVSGDKAYSSEQNIEAVFEAGGTPYIPFKINATDAKGGLWEKMLLFYQLRRDDFLAHYHKRSNAESTFSMIKAKFRDHVRSRTDTAMINEVLAKVLCHNLCCVIQSQCELGIEPLFWTGDSKRAQKDVREEVPSCTL
jgi:transposase